LRGDSSTNLRASIEWRSKARVGRPLIARHRPHVRTTQIVDWLAAQAKAFLKQPGEAAALAQASLEEG